MRKFFTSPFSFILSGFVGGLVAQQLAVATGAEEEYIIVFMFSVLVTCVVTFVFVAQLMNDPVAAAARTGKWTLIVFVVLLVLLIALILYSDSSAAVVKKDIPMAAGLGLPGLVTIILQSLFVRWRVRRGLIKAQMGVSA